MVGLSASWAGSRFRVRGRGEEEEMGEEGEEGMGEVKEEGGMGAGEDI